MRKTRSLMGKALLAMLALFVIGLPYVASTSASGTNSIPTASVFLSPPSISGTSGTTFTVNLNVSGIQVLSTFGAGIMFNHHTTKCTKVVQGTFMSNSSEYTTLFLAGAINNNVGIVGVSSETETGTATMNGSSMQWGPLLSWQFQMNGTGTSESDLHIIGFEALPVSGSPVIPCQIIDYYTTSVGYIVKIVGNPQGPFGVNSPAPYPGFNYQNFTKISEPIGGKTYQGNMSFVISAPDLENGFGFFNVTIPTALMDETWLVTLNGTEYTPIITSNAIAQTTTISMNFTYGSSGTTVVQILSTSVVPEFASVFSSELLAAVLVLTAFVAALFTMTTRSRKRRN